MDKAEFARTVIEADPSISHRALALAVIKMFGTGLSTVILSNLRAGNDPFEPRPRKRQGAQHDAEGSGLYVLADPEPPKESLPPLSGAAAYLVLADDVRVECKTKAEAKAEVLRLLLAGTRSRDIAVYGRRSIQVQTTHSVKIESSDEGGLDVSRGVNKAPTRGRRRSTRRQGVVKEGTTEIPSPQARVDDDADVVPAPAARTAVRSRAETLRRVTETEAALGHDVEDGTLEERIKSRLLG
jgi:hypothetical protein